jgi:hypothetical protein
LDHGLDKVGHIKDYQVCNVFDLLAIDNLQDLGGAILLSTYFGFTIEEAACYNMDNAILQLQETGMLFIDEGIADPELGARWVAPTYKLGDPIHLTDEIEGWCQIGNSSLLGSGLTPSEFRNQSKPLVQDILRINKIESLDAFREEWALSRIDQLSKLIYASDDACSPDRETVSEPYKLGVSLKTLSKMDLPGQRERRLTDDEAQRILESFAKHNPALPQGCRLDIGDSSRVSIKDGQEVELLFYVVASPITIADQFGKIAQIFFELNEIEVQQAFLPYRFKENISRPRWLHPDIEKTMSDILGCQVDPVMRAQIVSLEPEEFRP